MVDGVSFWIALFEAIHEKKKVLMIENYFMTLIKEHSSRQHQS